MGNIGQAEEEFALPGIGGVGVFADLIDAAADLTHLSLDGRGVFAVLFGNADLFAGAIAFALEGLALGLSLAALLVDGEDLIDHGREVATAKGEALFDEVGVFAEKADIEHGRRIVGWSGAGARASRSWFLAF